MITVGNDHCEWQVKNDLCWLIEEPATNAREQIEKAVHERYDREWRISDISVGRRQDRGVYTYYRVEYSMYPRHPGLGGRNETMFQFINDSLDASLQSAEL